MSSCLDKSSSALVEGIYIRRHTRYTGLSAIWAEALKNQGDLLRLHPGLCTKSSLFNEMSRIS